MRKVLNEINIPSLKDETMKQMASTGVLAKGSDGVLSALDTVRDMKENDEVKEKWSQEYKDSIDCNNPKGFSQKAHCQGRKKRVKEELDEAERTYLAKLKELARKYAYDDSTDSTTKEKIEKMFTQLKRQYRKGIEVEKEHKSADPRKIALDHLDEDPRYYDKLEKIESKEATSSGSAGAYSIPLFGKIETKESNDWTKDAQKNIDDTFNSLPKLKDLKQYGLKYSVKGLKNLLVKKTRPDGTYGDNRWKREEMPFPPELDTLNVLMQSRLGKYYFQKSAQKRDPNKGQWDWYNHIKKEDLDNFPIPESVFVMVVNILKNGDDEIVKMETKEATSSGSAGSYETPAAWAKTMKKKDWRGSAKTQIPGGKFVQVKKKCKKFPYCNQGDIKALKIFENETLKKVIKRVSDNNNISEQVIKNIIAYELSNKLK